MNTAGMFGSKVHLWGGLVFVFANFLFLVNKLNEMSNIFLGRWMQDVISGQHLALILVGQIALIVGFIAYYQCYAPRVGQGGKVALRLLCGGGITLALGHVTFMTALERYVPSAVLAHLEFLFLLVILGGLLLFVGLLWFGMLNLRRPVLTYWRWLPLCTGLLGVLGFIGFSGEEITAPFLLFRTLFALGLIGMGVVLALEKPRQHALDNH